MKVKSLFLVGKGGVGKSTISSLVALSLSKNKDIFLVSLDSAHNLGDIFGVKMSDKPKRVLENLYLLEVDVDKKIKQYLEDIERDLVRSNTNLSAFNLLDEFEIIKQSPGLEEYGLLKAYSDILEENKNLDYIIFDMPPTALTLKFFNLSERSLLWIKKLIGLREHIKEKKEIVSNIKIGKKNIEKDRILEKLYFQKKYYERIINLLKSNSTEIILVINPDNLSQNEGKFTIDQMNNYGFKIKKIFNNKYLRSNKVLNDFNYLPIVNLPSAKYDLIGLKNLNQYLEGNSISL